MVALGSRRGVYIFYLKHQSVREVKAWLDESSICLPKPGQTFSRGALYTILKNPIYIGRVHHKGTTYPGRHEAIINEATWNRVNKTLTNNTSKRHPRSQHVSLLAGLLFDDAGNPMSPTHTRKGEKHYRYYVSQARLQYRDHDIGSVERISATALENTLIEAISDFLNDTKQLISLLDLKAATPLTVERVIDHVRGHTRTWVLKPPFEQKALLNQLLNRITISRTELTITIDLASLADFFKTPQPTSPIAHTLALPVSLQRCGMESRLIVEGHSVMAPHASHQALQEALQQALEWSNALASGGYDSVQALATSQRVSGAYVRRILKLTLLAPDVMQRIVSEEVPTKLTLENLKTGIPDDWQEQRSKFIGR